MRSFCLQNCVLITGFKRGVLEYPLQGSKVLCFGGAKAPSLFDRGLGPEERAQEKG